MKDTRDCPCTTHSFKILGKCYKKCPYFSSLTMKCMHNIQESYQKVILLAIIPHLTESLKAHSIIHQAQKYPSGYVYIASLKREQKEYWEQPEQSTLLHSPPGHAWASQATLDPPAASLLGNGCCYSKLSPRSLSLASHIPSGLQAMLPRHSLRLSSQACHLEGQLVWHQESVTSQCMPCSIWKAEAIKYLTYWTRALPAKRNSN